jgi:1,2-diacylglycerol 3-alpha-glucosyltransferase
MKIVHVCLCSSYNDGWSYQDNCLPYYHKQAGHDVTVITTPFTNDKKSTGYLFYKTGEYYDQNGVKIIRKPLRFSNKSKISFKLRLYIGLYDSLVAEQPDIIFVHGCQFLDIRYIVKYAKTNPAVKIYVDGHEDFGNSARNWLSKNVLHRIIWKHCAQLIEPYTTMFWGVLPARMDFLVNMYDLPKEKVGLLVMGAEDEKVEEAKDENLRNSIRAKFNINQDDFLIMSGGKIDQNKPQTLLLMEAVKNINIDNVKLIIFGSVIPQLEKKFKSLLGESVQYIGWIDSKETYKYFNAADLVVFPGLHSVFWEQVVGLGKPCVFRYMEGFTHIDLGGNCKFLYEDSVDEIVKKISEIVNNTNVFNNMKEIAHTKGMEVFSYKGIAKKSISNISINK